MSAAAENGEEELLVSDFFFNVSAAQLRRLSAQGSVFGLMPPCSHPPFLQDYEEEEAVDTEAATKVDAEKKGYVGIHATGFKELMLKPELLQAITACGFEHPSEGTSGSSSFRVSSVCLAANLVTRS